MRTLSRVALFVVGILTCVQLGLPRTAHAAGNAVVTVEGASSLNTTQTTELSFYVTASGANLYAVSFRANFTKLSFVANSFNASGTDFTGISTPVGSSAGQIEIAASFQGDFGPTAGGGGKLYVGKVTVQADGTAGTGRISFDQVSAADSMNAPMTASSQAKNITISQASCPAGQVGTPPTCTTPSAGGSGTTPPAAPPSSNQVAVPEAQDEPKTKIIGEDELKAVLTKDETPANQEEAPSAMSEPQALPWKTVKWIGAAALGLLVVLIGIGLLKRRYNRWKELRRHVAARYDPIAPSLPSPQSPSSSPTPNQSPQNSGPTIIRPTNGDGKDVL